MPELVFFRRGEEVLRFQLSGARVVLGRGDRNDVVIPDPEVSRQQVALIREGGQFHVKDLSGKGTVISGSARSEGLLGDGEDISLGQWRAIFREHTAGDEQEATHLGGTRTEQTPGPELGRYQAAQLRVRHAGTEHVHRLSGEPFTLGKESGNDILVEDRFLSGRHLKVNRRENLFHLVDLGSTNGTWLGGARLFEAEVPFHTTLTAGGVELVLEPAASGGRKEAPPFHGIIGTDPAIRHLIEMIRRVAPSTAAVTVLGESGTGKELVAQALHAASTRLDRAFIPVNCAAISKELIESEPFGHT